MAISASDHFPVLLGKRKLKISAVAKSTGISRTTLTNLYYGKSKGISFEVLEKLCECLHCSPCDIIGPEDERK